MMQPTRPVIRHKLKLGSAFQRGFSLVEAMVGFGVFAVGMLGVAMLTNRGTHDTADARVYGVAMQYLSQRVEPLVGAARVGAPTLIGRLNSLTAEPDIKVIGDIGVELVSAIDGNNVNLVPLITRRAADLPALRPPYVLVLRLSYTDDNNKIKTMTPVTRVITP